MPVVDVDLDELASLVRWRGDPAGLLDELPYAGVDIEHVDEDGRSVRIEYNPNRPDFATEYGLAAYMRGLLGIEVGPVDVRAARSGVVFNVDSSVRSVRPYIAGLVAQGVRLDEPKIRQLIRLQEDLHDGIGRRRRKVAIGLHDLRKVSPPVRYMAVPGTYAFVPLDESREWTVQEVLMGHPTGKKYAWILEGMSSYPMIVDSRGYTLSFPPIINGERTRLTEDTDELLVDITGTDLDRVLDAAAVLALTLGEMGASIGSILVDYGDLSMETPDLSSYEMSVDVDTVNGILGLRLTPADVARALLRARLGISLTGERLTVRVPRYRFDVMHEADLAEEVAYGYGFRGMRPEAAADPTVGSTSTIARQEESIRDVIVGLGFQEVITTHLTSYWSLYTGPGREPSSPVRALSTKSSEHEYVRDSLVPGLLGVLSANAHNGYPQRIFEVGTVIQAGGGGRSPAESEAAAMAIAHARASFTEVKSAVDALIRSLVSSTPTYAAVPCPAPFSEGRCALVELDGVPVGIIGEVHPAVLERYGLQVPVAIADLAVAALCGQGAKD